MLPFTREQFFGVFVDYNASVWPVQVVACLVGIGAIACLVRPTRTGSRVIAGVLALMWAWTGIVYHGLHFSRINPAAYAFGALFLLQGLMWLHVGVVKPRLDFDTRAGSSPAWGWALLAYAMVAYPLIGLWGGHRAGELPMFGITPCPVTLFSFGLLLLAAPPVPRSLLVIPILWSLVGGSAAFLLGVPQDWPLLFGGVVTAVMLWRRRTGALTRAPRPGSGPPLP